MSTRWVSPCRMPQRLPPAGIERLNLNALSRCKVDQRRQASLQATDDPGRELVLRHKTEGRNTAMDA